MLEYHEPEYAEEEEKYEIRKFEKPLLLFPMKLVEYLSYIYQVLSLCVTNKKGEIGIYKLPVYIKCNSKIT